VSLIFDVLIVSRFEDGGSYLVVSIQCRSKHCILFNACLGKVWCTTRRKEHNNGASAFQELKILVEKLWRLLSPNFVEHVVGGNLVMFNIL
jgi:hypothetical protein